MDFVEALEARMEDIASACTQCGRCFQACPMTVPTGIAEADPKHVLAGIVDLLRGGDGNAEAATWAAACSSSGYCIEACDYAVNPRTMVRLAHFASVKRHDGDEVKSNAMKSFRGMAKAVRVVSRLQLDAAEIDALLGAVELSLPPAHSRNERVPRSHAGLISTVDSSEGAVAARVRPAIGDEPEESA